MEYSTEDFAAARGLQFAAYIYVSMATFWVYDYACSLHEEWSFLLQSHWSKVKGLYIVTRYLPIIILTTSLYLGFMPGGNPGKCRGFYNINTGLCIISVTCSECFFILRIYALSKNNKILLAVMLSTFFMCLAASFGISFANIVPAAFATSAIPGITGCYHSSTSFRLFIPFLLLAGFELGLMILTLIPAMQNWRIGPTHLYAVLVKHNIFYYSCGFLFSVTNIFASMHLHYSYHALLYDFQFMILAILATRMHLHLWEVNQYAHGSGALVGIPMSDISYLSFTA
jgi:hypothetical protein